MLRSSSNTAPVLEPNLIVQEPPKLFGEKANRRLRSFARLKPVEVDARQTGIEVGERLDGMKAVQQIGQLLLAFGREQEVIERSEASALVGLGDTLAIRDYVIEQLALGASPAGDLLA